MQNNSATQPVYSVANTELGSIGRRMRRARGSRPSPSPPPPPLQLKFQQRGAKQARATFPAIYCVNQCATAAYRASRAAHSLHQPTSMGAKSGSLRKVLPFAFSCRRRTGLTEQQPVLVLVSALLQTGRSRGSCSKRRTAQADGLHDGDSQRSIAGGPKQLLALQRCVSAALRRVHYDSAFTSTTIACITAHMPNSPEPSSEQTRSGTGRTLSDTCERCSL